MPVADFGVVGWWCSDPFGSVESVKAASDVYAPVSGEIVESNKVHAHTNDMTHRHGCCWAGESGRGQMGMRVGGWWH